MRFTRVARVVGIAFATLATADAQSLTDIRDQLAEDIGAATFAQLTASLGHLTMSPDIDAASYRVDDTDGTEFSTLKLPYHTEFEFDGAPGALYLEGGLGYLHASETTRFERPDLGLDTKVFQKWRAFAGGLGVGWRFPLGRGFSIRPSVGIALSYVENRSTYQENGAVHIEPITEGIVYNWNATALTYDTSLTLLYEHAFDKEDHWRVEAQSRFVWAWTDVVHATSRYQDGSDDGPLSLSRFDLFGPTPWRVFGAPLGWNGFAQYTWIGDAKPVLGFDRFLELGLAVEADVTDVLPVSKLRISGAVITGADVTGWTFGFSFSF